MICRNIFLLKQDTSSRLFLFIIIFSVLSVQLFQIDAVLPSLAVSEQIESLGDTKQITNVMNRIDPTFFLDIVRSPKTAGVWVDQLVYCL